MTPKYKIFVLVINIVTIMATIACAYAVIANNFIVINVSVLLLDGLCIILAVGLLANRRARFFAIVMLIMTVSDISFLNAYASLIVDTLSPVIYILLAQAVTTLKAGEQYAE